MRVGQEDLLQILETMFSGKIDVSLKAKSET
jgi:hypothetical protein